MGGENDNGGGDEKDLEDAELGSHSPRAAVGERLGAPAFLFEVFSGGASHQERACESRSEAELP